MAFTTILHRREAIKTADTIVVGTDFFINPMPADIMPMLAAMKDMISVISIACARIKSVKLSFTRCINCSVRPNIRNIAMLLTVIDITVNRHTIPSFDNRIFFRLTG